VAAADKTDSVLQVWPPHPVSFMRRLDGPLALRNVMCASAWQDGGPALLLRFVLGSQVLEV
jgi:hypothetical protein